MKPMWQLFSGQAHEDFIDGVLDIAGDQILQEGTIFNEAKDVRRSKITWLSHRKEIRNYIFEYVQTANRNAFGFNVVNQGDLQYTLYDGKEKGHYDWHVDIDWTSSAPFDRKLSVTVQLSDPDDYEGGDFEIEGENPPSKDAKKKGSILVFPSYARHRVMPVTSGIRKSLVAWFEGPKWA